MTASSESGSSLTAVLNSSLGLLQIVVQPVQPAQQKMVVHVVGLDLDDLLILLDGQLENILRALSRLHVAQRAQINAAQQLVGFQVVGIALQDVLRLEDGIPNAAGLGIHLGQRGRQVFGSRIGIDGQPVFLNGFVGQLAAAVDGHLLLVHVSQSVVVVRGGLIQLCGARAWWQVWNPQPGFARRKQQG